MADFFFTGAVELFVLPRSVTFDLQGLTILRTTITTNPSWMYLGAAVGWPEVEITRFARDVKTDASCDAPFQKINTSESHTISVTLNRINFQTLNLIRTGNSSPSTYNLKPGRLMLASTDFRLFLRYANAGTLPGLLSPAGTSGGRLYYSACYAGGREEQPSRVQEVGLVFSCNPLWDKPNRQFNFYTEDATSTDWPKNLTLE